jgi:hypothetical protein
MPFALASIGTYYALFDEVINEVAICESPKARLTHPHSDALLSAKRWWQQARHAAECHVYRDRGVNVALFRGRCSTGTERIGHMAHVIMAVKREDYNGRDGAK